MRSGGCGENCWVPMKELLGTAVRRGWGTRDTVQVIERSPSMHALRPVVMVVVCIQEVA